MINYENRIVPKDKTFELKLKDIWKYRDLLMLFVRRDFVAVYKQTILGPAWFFIQPLFTTVVYTFIFGNVAKISTDGVPTYPFYLAGVTAWNYFANSLTVISETFTKNASLFGKVYFPRAITPLSIVISNLIQFGFQFVLFMGIYIYYYQLPDSSIFPNQTIALFPLLIISMAFLSLGFGMIISSLTTKYRDLKFLIKFGIQLLMYASSVIIPLSEIPNKYQTLVMCNPMVGIIETFKYMFFSKGTFSLQLLSFSFISSIIVFLIGLAVFNKTEKNFMDTV